MPNNENAVNQNITETNASDITEAEIVDEAKVKAEAVEAERQRIDEKINLSSSGSLAINTEDLANAVALQQAALPEDQKIKNLTETLEPLFHKYNEKYGLDFKFTTFKETIEFVVTASEDKKELYRLINESIVVNLIEIVTIKAILTLSSVINNQLVNLQSPALNNDWSVNTIMTVEKVFQWIEQLNVLRERYKSFNIEGRIKRVSEKMKSNELKSGDQSLPGFESAEEANKVKLIDLLQKALQDDDKLDGGDVQ